MAGCTYNVNVKHLRSFGGLRGEYRVAKVDKKYIEKNSFLANISSAIAISKIASNLYFDVGIPLGFRITCSFFFSVATDY